MAEDKQPASFSWEVGYGPGVIRLRLIMPCGRCSFELFPAVAGARELAAGLIESCDGADALAAAPEVLHATAGAHEHRGRRPQAAAQTGVGVASTFWTAERRDEALRLAQDGLSAAAIGNALGCTKNAVIGMFNRGAIGLIKLRRERQEPAPPPKSESVMTGCRWIIGDVGRKSDWHYCAAAVTEPGGSWCKQHRARVYQGHARLEDA